MFSKTKIIIIIENYFDYNEYISKNAFYIAIYFNIRI